MGCCDCDEPRADLYQSTLLTPRTLEQVFVTRRLDVFFFLLFPGLYFSLFFVHMVTKYEYTALAAIAIFIFTWSNGFIWLWLRIRAEEDWRTLSDAEKQELPSTLCFPTNMAGKAIMVLWIVAFVLLPLAMLLFGGPIVYIDDDLGDDFFYLRNGY
jgi:hypothetical protein